MISNKDSPRAWLVLTGSFTCLFCTVGFMNAFGVFEEYYARDILSPLQPSTIAWIGAVSIFFLFSLSAVTGGILDVFGPKVRNCSSTEKTFAYSIRSWSV